MNKSYILNMQRVTEKTISLREKNRVYVFMVHPDANKIEIKAAIEEQFEVKVSSVNVIRVRPRVRKRQGRVVGQKPGYKKAYVKLAEGQKIDIFEGV